MRIMLHRHNKNNSNNNNNSQQPIGCLINDNNLYRLQSEYTRCSIFIRVDSLRFECSGGPCICSFRVLCSMAYIGYKYNKRNASNTITHFEFPHNRHCIFAYSQNQWHPEWYSWSAEKKVVRAKYPPVREWEMYGNGIRGGAGRGWESWKKNCGKQ